MMMMMMLSHCIIIAVHLLHMVLLVIGRFWCRSPLPDSGQVHIVWVGGAPCRADRLHMPDNASQIGVGYNLCYVPYLLLNI